MHTKQQLQQWRMTRSSPDSHAPPPPTTSPKQPRASSPPHKELQDSTATSNHQPDSLVSQSLFCFCLLLTSQCFFFFGQDEGRSLQRKGKAWQVRVQVSLPNWLTKLVPLLSVIFPFFVELIGELLSSSKSSQSTPTSSHSLGSSNKGDSLHSS